MKQNILIATLLAAMLALAGCGGGSSSGLAKTDDMKTAEPKPLPDTGLSYEKDGANEYRVLKDKPLSTANGKITCPVDECIITVAAQGGTPVVTATGGAEFEKTAPPPDPSGTAQPTDSTNPLSHDVLFKVVTGAETLWKGKGDALADNTLADNTNSSDPNLNQLQMKKGSETTKLLLKSLGAGADPTPKKDGAYVYWGVWSKETAESGSGKTTQGMYGVVMGGGKPYGKKPDSPMKADGTAVTTATYTDRNAMVSYRKKSTDGWTVLTGRTAMLKADFSTGMIGGNINTGANGVTFTGVTGGVGNILFRDTSIGSDGKFSGNVEDSVSTGETGSWDGQFFGDTTGFGGTPRKSINLVPSHATAAFSMSRPETKRSDGTTKQDALHISGAFGAVAVTP